MLSKAYWDLELSFFMIEEETLLQIGLDLQLQLCLEFWLQVVTVKQVHIPYVLIRFTVFV